MPPIRDALRAIGLGIGGAAALIALVILVAWLADRRAEHDFPQVVRDLAADQTIQPGNTL